MFPIMAGNSASTGYNLTRSLRFRASASGYLNRTPATTTNRKVWTWSGWVKRGILGANLSLFSVDNNSASNAYISMLLNSGDEFQIFEYDGSAYTYRLATNAVFRDPSGWYHFVCAVDTDQGTNTNRIKLYVNGVQLTSLRLTEYPTSGLATYANTVGNLHAIGATVGATTSPERYFDGYITEVNFIDGQALTPSSFGSTNALTGVWQPARYTGTYGTNGFYLPFTDNSALTTSSNVGLGKDFSGNGNYWVTNNISITAGVTYDSMTDVPTLTSATAANFAVLNPLNAELGMTGTPSDGNLTIAVGGGKRSTIAARSGKWYWEFVSNSGAASNFPMSGIYVAGLGTYYPGLDGNSVGYFQGGDIYYNGVIVFTASSFTNGDIIGFAWDADTGKVYVSKNNTWQNSGNPAAGTGQVATISTGVDRVVGAYLSSGSCSINFGQQPFQYTPPTGFVALNTYNLPTSTIVKGNTVMDATLYTGTGATQSITNAAAFKPDLVWIKSRSAGQDHNLYDSVRGVNNYLTSDTTAAAVAVTQGLSSFATNGFSVGTGSDAAVNTLGQTYVGWQWLKSASAGFDIVTFTGNGGGQTFAHNLGVAPGLMICKSRNNAQDWYVYHSSIGGTGALSLNTTAATATSVSYWSNVTPGSSTFSVGGNFSSGYTYVNYLFAPIAGFSAFGSYTGNGSADGPFVYTGFRPKWLTVKRTDTAGTNWLLQDSVRGPYNLTENTLYPNLSDAEATGAGYFDLLSNGFKLRTSGTGLNASGGTYIYMCFAENPLKNSLAR